MARPPHSTTFRGRTWSESGTCAAGRSGFWCVVFLNTGWSISSVSLGWVDFDLYNVPLSCPAAQPLLPISNQLKQNQTEGGTAKIKVNPTILSDLMPLPVLTWFSRIQPTRLRPKRRMWQSRPPPHTRLPRHPPSPLHRPRRPRPPKWTWSLQWPPKS